MRLLAVDCSLNTPGAALFVDRVLVRAARVRAPKALSSEPIAARCASVARAILRWRVDVGQGSGVVLDELVVEWPQIYRAAKSKGDPNDLIGIAGVAAALAALCGCPTRSPTPAEWIGQVPKATSGDPWSSPRGARVRARLMGNEIACIEVNHDAIDAVGLGLWALGRFERVRKFPGST